MKKIYMKKIFYICMFIALIAARISNYESFVFGGSPTIIGMIFSCTYYVVWLLILIFTRFKYKIGFTLFVIYWGNIFLLGLLGYTGLAHNIGDIILLWVYLFLIPISGFKTEVVYLIALIMSSVYLMIGTYKWLTKK